ncbi:MAG: hypothetical protein JW904_15070 [Spirochaetales bacterium]|nr:hypothetical protein [Spirochaetales bacterium]
MKIKRPLFLATVLINTVILGVLTGGGFLVANVFFNGKIPVSAVPYVIIGFFLAGLFGTALASRWYTSRIIREKGLLEDEQEKKKISHRGTKHTEGKKQP